MDVIDHKYKKKSAFLRWTGSSCRIVFSLFLAIIYVSTEIPIEYMVLSYLVCNGGRSI